MAYLRNQYQTRPGMAASLGLSILTVMLVAFATMVPFPYSAITGYKIMVTTSGAGPSPSSEQLTAALEDSGLQGATMTSGSDEGTYIVQGTVSETQVKQLADIIAEMSGTDATAQVEPIMSTVSGTLYAQVTGKHEPSKQQKPPLRLQDGHLHVDSSAVDSLGCPELYRDSNIVPSLEKVLRKTGLRNSDIGLAVQKASDQGYKIVWLATNRDSTTANMDSAKAVGLLMKSAGSKDVMALIMGNYPIDTAKLSVKFFDALNKRGLHPGRLKVNVSSSDDSSASAGKK